MPGSKHWLIVAIVALVAAIAGFLIFHDAAGGGDTLPRLGLASDFRLTNQDGGFSTLNELRGRVVAVTFIFASCFDTCPMLTGKLKQVQTQLGPDFGRQVAFVSITVDPEHDTPTVLRRYAEAHAVNFSGWTFLTGSPLEIRQIARDYGVVFRRGSAETIDHTLLTTLIDRRGVVRVRYVGSRFDPDELHDDLRRLVREGEIRWRFG